MKNFYIKSMLYRAAYGVVSALLLLACVSVTAQGVSEFDQSKTENTFNSVKVVPQTKVGEIERVNERTLTTKTFTLKDGGTRLLSFAGPIHYKSGNDFLDIDLSISHNLDELYPYANLGNSFKTYYSVNPTKTPIKTIVSGGNEITEKVTRFYTAKSSNLKSLAEFEFSKGDLKTQIEKGNIVYKEVFSGIDFRYTQYNVGRNFDIIVKDKSFINQFPKNSEVVVIEEHIVIPSNWVVKKENGEINFYSNGKLEASIPAPIMKEEAVGKQYESESDFMSIGEVNFKRNGDMVIISSSFSVEWLKDKNRSFPIAIDPTWVLSADVAAGYTGNQTSATSKATTQLRLAVPTATSCWAKFNIPTIPASASMSKVVYTGAPYSGTQTPEKYVSIYPMWGTDPVTAVAADIWNSIDSATALVANYEFNKVGAPSAADPNFTTSSDPLNSLAHHYIMQSSGSWVAFGFRQDSGPTGFSYQGAWNSNAPPFIDIVFYDGVCAGIPNAGTLNGITEVCKDKEFTLSLLGSNVSAQGIEVEWQASNNGTTNWQKVSDVLDESITLSQTTTQHYRVMMKCTNSGQVSYSNVLKVEVASLPIMGGTFTVDRNAAISSSNYHSLNDLFESLECRGLFGSLTINIIDDGNPFVEQIDIPEIPGLSSNNNIVINGGNSTIEFASTATANNFIFRFNESSSYITIKNLTLKNKGTSFANLVQFAGNTKNVTFENVIFEGYANASSNSVNLALVYFINSTLINNFTTFKDCKFFGGSTGVYYQSSSSSIFGATGMRLRVENSDFENQYQYGIYLNYGSGHQIYNNNIHSENSNTTYYGIYSNWNLTVADTLNNEFVGNTIYHNNGGYGMYLNYMGVNSGAATRQFNLVYNNVIYMGGPNVTTATYGLWMSKNSKTQVFHNTVHVETNEGVNSAAFWFNSIYSSTVGPYGHYIYNNTFTSSGKALVINKPTLTNNYVNFNTTVFMDYNNFYSNNSRIASFEGKELSDIREWMEITGADRSSISQDPAYRQSVKYPIDLRSRDEKFRLQVPLLKEVLVDSRGVARDRDVYKGRTDIGAFQLNYDLATEIFVDFSDGACDPSDIDDIPGFIYFRNLGDFDINNGTVKLGIYRNGTPELETPYPINISNGATLSLPISADFTYYKKDMLTIYGIPADFTDENPYNDFDTIYSVEFGKTPYGSKISTGNIGKAIAPSSSDPYWKAPSGSSLTFDVTRPENNFASGVDKYGLDTGYTIDVYAYLKGSNEFLPQNATSYQHGSTIGEWTLNVPGVEYADEVIVYEMHIENPRTGCDTIINIEVAVIEVGVPDFDIHYTSNCEGSNITFENLSTIGNGTLTYKWEFGDTKTSTSKNPDNSYLKSGTYNVTLYTYTSPDQFESSITKQVVINANPKAEFSFDEQCEGTLFKFEDKSTNLISGTTYSYAWDFDNGLTSNLQNPSNVFLNHGTYNVSLTLTSDKGCSGSVSHDVNVYPFPVADFSFSTQNCFGDDVQFNNLSSIPSTNWSSSWDFADGEGSSQDTNASFNFGTTGLKNVTLIVNSEFGCSDKVSKQVMINEVPQAEITTFGTNCVGNPISLDGGLTTPSNLTSDYAWDVNGDNYADKSPQVTFDNSGLQIIKLVVTYSNGCVSEEAEKQINIEAFPHAEFDIDDLICAGNEVLIVNKSTVEDGDAVYFWNMGDGNTYDSIEAPQHSYSNTKAQDYVITLKVSTESGVCSQVTSQVVRAGVVPSCNFEINSLYMPGHRTYSFMADEPFASY